MTLNVVTIDDETIHIYHERCPERPMEVWSRPGITTGAHANIPMWFWNLKGGKVIGSDMNMMVALEMGMTALTHMVEGNPNDD